MERDLDGGAFHSPDEAQLQQHAPPQLRWVHQPMPDEQHQTIFHPAALRAFRALFAPPPT